RAWERYLHREARRTYARRVRHWRWDFGSLDAYERSVAGMRRRWEALLGGWPRPGGSPRPHTEVLATEDGTGGRRPAGRPRGCPPRPPRGGGGRGARRGGPRRGGPLGPPPLGGWGAPPLPPPPRPPRGGAPPPPGPPPAGPRPAVLVQHGLSGTPEGAVGLVPG